jgi:hypothetical protein
VAQSISGRLRPFGTSFALSPATPDPSQVRSSLAPRSHWHSPMQWFREPGFDNHHPAAVPLHSHPTLSPPLAPRGSKAVQAPAPAPVHGLRGTLTHARRPRSHSLCYSPPGVRHVPPLQASIFDANLQVPDLLPVPNAAHSLDLSPPMNMHAMGAGAPGESPGALPPSPGPMLSMDNMGSRSTSTAAVPDVRFHLPDGDRLSCLR